ncbi:hypothetical protein B0O99DRAFT_681747 [Bisporella sp. PMI_857]|nr:hypothetical protein B0O99DRAFT_681747 [Bisporella sp. PMI_857]
MSDPPPRPSPLHQRSESRSNSDSISRPTLRLVPNEPPRLLGQSEDVPITRRTPLPTHPSHFLSPGKGRSKDALHYEFQHPYKAQPSRGASGSSISTTHTLPQPPQDVDSGTGPSSPRPKPVPKKRLQIHKDSKTFSLVPQDTSEPAEDHIQSPRSPPLSTKSSFASLRAEQHNAKGQSNSNISCIPESTLTGSAEPSIEPSTPLPASKQSIPVDPIANSPWNYQLVGGIRKVAKTPEPKQTREEIASQPSPLPRISDVTTEGTVSSIPRTSDATNITDITVLSSEPRVSDVQACSTRVLSTRQSFQSTQTATTTSETTNYKVYGPGSASASASESALLPPSSSDSNYQLLGEPSPSPTGSVIIHRSRTSESESVFETTNYELHGDPSPSPSYTNLQLPVKYSRESLVVPPLQPRTRRSNDTLGLGYYKSRSRESLRTGSLTSISTVLSQQQAAKATVGTGSLINLPSLPPKPKVIVGSWADTLAVYPLRSPMNETPHQWSSQLSTVHSESEGGTDRGSRSWSDDNGRLSGSGFIPSTPSRHSRQMLSISSSMASPVSPPESDLEPPRAIYRNGRHASTSSAPIIEDLDEYGDGITNMQELRMRPSRTRLSSFLSSSSDNGRTSTMRSSVSSMRANSLLQSTLPTWARLYYGSGERRYLGASGSDAGYDSRSNSFRSGSPNTDNFPSNIYSPRRRPREQNAQAGPSGRGSLEIRPAPYVSDDGQLINDPYSRKFRTWSMSSIWSPHLRMDRRATHRHTMFDPPSLNWSTEGRWWGRRNIQIVMFIVGFVIPFAWMIAAVLPLPARPMRDMEEQNSSSDRLDSSNFRPDDYTRQFGPLDEARYESTRWWRRLNRFMSMIGILIVAAVIILVVVSIKEGW